MVFSSTLVYIFVFILGTIIGSFLNVVILRLGNENGPKSLGGRSKCPKCLHQLAVPDLIPFFSYIFLQGKCRYCKTKISIQYPIIELITALVFLFAFYKTQNNLILFIPLALALSSLLAIFVIDMRTKIIPDELSFSFAVFSGIYSVLNENYKYILVGFIFYIPFYLIWKLSDGKAMGLGDGKLAIGIGFLLGMANGLSAITLAFWIGAIYGITILLKSRLWKSREHITIKSEVPFGPFLILGTLVALILPMDIFQTDTWYLLF